MAFSLVMCDEPYALSNGTTVYVRDRPEGEHAGLYMPHSRAPWHALQESEHIDLLNFCMSAGISKMRELKVLFRVAPFLGRSPLYYHLTRQKVPMDLIAALSSKAQDAVNLMPKDKELCKTSDAKCEAFLLYPPTAPWQAVSAVVYDLVALATLPNMTALKAQAPGQGFLQWERRR